ncbi:MAG: hypothetical protein ABR587_10005 [Candidatus Binatia bacterium]
MLRNIRRPPLSPIALAGVLACLNASPAVGEVEPPALRRDIGAFALFGRSYVKWHGAATMPLRGSVGSLSLVEFPARTNASGDESYVAAPSVVAKNSSHIHFVYAADFAGEAGVVLDHPPAALEGALVAEIDYPQLPAMSCGGSDVTVDSSNSPMTLAPGRYRDVLVTADQTLRLVAGGRYELCSLRVRAGATVEAGTGNRMLIRDYLATSARTQITGPGACGAQWIVFATPPSYSPTGSAIDFDHGGPGSRARIEGQFFTPGRISMAQHNDYVGRFWADRIDGRVADSITRTLSDCHAPRCGDGVLDAGESCDDGNNRDGDCCSAFCDLMAVGSACEDGRFCTVADACDASARCVGSGNPCESPDGDANCSESCNEDTNACDGPDPDASPCDDGRYCNGADMCASGQCVAHSGSPCPGPDDDTDCRESCNEATHACDAPDLAGAACNDGRYCTTGETCDSAGTCQGGTQTCPGADADGDCAESCDELADSCTAFDTDGTPCNDGMFCTGTDLCDGRGQCRGHGDPCAPALGDGDADCSESCSEAAGACTAPDLDGSPCSDGLACTLGERCMAGTCAASGVTSCDDSNPCTDEFCAPDGSCERSYNSAPCHDGNACTLDDHCILGVCGATEVMDCRDDDLCSSDTCDPSDGTCHHSWSPAQDCDGMGRSLTRIDLSFSPKDGAPFERLMTSWRSESDEDATWREDLGDPSLGDAFAVCFYDESRELPSLAYRLDFDAGTLEGAGWKRTARGDDLIYKLTAPAGTSQGVSSVRIGGGKRGSPTFRLRAGAGGGCSGECREKFDPPPASAEGRLFAMQPAMTVQWVAETGACWSSRYDQADVNTAHSFRARSRPRP